MKIKERINHQSMQCISGDEEGGRSGEGERWRQPSATGCSNCVDVASQEGKKMGSAI
jgi:hypothetical protein